VWADAAPGLIAYDSAGNEVAECVYSSSCHDSIWITVGQNVGSVRVKTAAPVIKRVIFAPPFSSIAARATLIQYNKPEPCSPRRADAGNLSHSPILAAASADMRHVRSNIGQAVIAGQRLSPP
jgi:hypothetical protein